MIDGNLTEFIDQLYYGYEIVYLYQNKRYFIQGWWNEEGKAIMVLDDVTELKKKNYLWKHSADNMRECAESFLTAPIWEGKNFLEIQEDVIWSDW